MIRPHKKPHRAGWTLVEMLVAAVVFAVLATIVTQVTVAAKKRAHRARAVEKLRTLGTAMASYVSDRNGQLPWEDAPGEDDWRAFADPENSEVWYNALPRTMAVKAAAEITMDPRFFYEDNYPLYLPGADYPSGAKKLASPHFAIAMNSRLQRKDEHGNKKRGTMTAIQDAHRTVVFLERGLPGDKKTNSGQRGFDGSPKANPRAFVARYNNKGLLICADGHVEARAVSELISSGGQIIFPQTDMVWTNDPDDDPN